MFEAFTTQLAWVICFMIVTGSLLIGGIVLLAFEYKKEQARTNPKKRTIDPRQHYPQAGMCMCGDGFNFHIDGRRCNVEGCPCVVYIPSDAEDSTLAEVGLIGMSRLAIEGVNAKSDWLSKQEQLQALKNKAITDQIGPLNNTYCRVCGSKSHNVDYHVKHGRDDY